MLIGRESEKAVIAALLAGARVGESGALVLTGEAGIGKTALLDWAATTIGDMQLLRATGIEAEQVVSFGGLLQLLRPVLRLLDTLPDPQAAGLSAALALRAGSPADRFAVGAGTLGLIGRAAERRPLVLIIDDAHLLDRPSAEAIAFAARRLLVDPVLLLAGVRAGEPCALTEVGLPEITIGALDHAEAAELIAGRGVIDLPAESLDRLYRATGGNPLGLLELSTDIYGVLALPPQAPVPVPQAVARAVARETARLDPAARTALVVAAASGGELSHVVRAMALLGVDSSALQRLERANLLSSTADRVGFRHPLVRSSVYRAADPDDLRAVHRMLFAALPEADLQRRAWHLAEATTGPDDEAAALLERAAVEASGRSADAVAATWFERSARWSTDSASGVGRLVSAGESAWLAGQVGRARALLDEALHSASTPAQLIRTQEILGAIDARSGSLLDARDTLSRAASQAEELDPELAVTLLADAINACFYLGDLAWVAGAIDRMNRLLSIVRSPRAQILGLMAVGTAGVLAGKGGVDDIRRAVEMLADSDELMDDPRRMALLVLGPLFLRESITGRELILRVAEEIRRRAAIGALPMLLFHLGRDDAATDRWARASSEYHESIRLARETGQTTELAASLAGLGWLEARQGMRAESQVHLDESAQLCEAHQIHLFRAWTYYGLGDLECGIGSITAALGHFEAMTAHLQRNGIHDVDLAPGPERVEVLLRLGRPDDALAVAHEYHDRAVAKGQPWAMARAERALAMCLAGPEGDEHFTAALGLHTATLDDYEKAKTLLAQGSRFRRSRRRAEARTPLRQAWEIFDRLGATPHTAQAAVELEATGERPHPRGASMLSDLTPQELQIATMLAGGRSTRETASAMFLSPKTVEYHLRHVYTKLDVHSRKELAEILLRDERT